MGGVPMIRLLWCLLLLGFGRAALAGYASVPAPAGFSTSAGSHFFTPAANAPWVGGSAAAQVTANVGGRAVVMPASMRLASNAAAFAVAAIRLNPTTLVAGAVATWLLTYGIDYVNGQFRKTTSVQQCFYGGWVGECMWVAQQLAVAAGIPPSILTGCGPQAGGYFYCQTPGYGGGLTVNLGSPQNTTQPASEADLTGPGSPGAATSLPDAVANAIPAPLPVQLPVINPSADPVPVPLPYRIPAGDPVPVPDSSPQRWTKPYIDIKPSPIPLDPWRVDIIPGTVEEEDQTPLPDGPPGGSTGTPVPRPDTQALCEQYPDIAACKPLGEAPEAPALPVQDVTADFSDRITFGADTAACPAPRVMHTTLAGDLQLSWEGACMFADGIRPVVVALAYLAAAASFFGIGFARGD